MWFLAPFQVDPFDVQEFVDLCMEAAKLPSREKLAMVLGVDESQLHRQLNGEGHVSLSRIVAKLGKADPAFYPRLGWLLVQQFGLPREAKQAALLVRAYSARRRQLKMNAAKAPQRRSA